MTMNVQNVNPNIKIQLPTRSVVNFAPRTKLKKLTRLQMQVYII